MKNDAREISQFLAEHALDIAQYLLPNGKLRGNDWKVGSLSGEAGHSLGVCVKGAKKGLFYDFATGEGGDLLKLWMIVRNLSLPYAIKDIKSHFRIDRI